MVDRDAAYWRPTAFANSDEQSVSSQDKTSSTSEDDCPEKNIHEERRVLLYHLCSLVDNNECSLDFLVVTDLEKKSYFKIFYKALVRETIELYNRLASKEDS